MSPREKKLLIFFAVAGFAVLNFLGFGFYKGRRVDADSARDQATQKLELSERIGASRDEVTDEMDWLAEHEPEPAAPQDVQTKLQQACENEARTTSLIIKSQKPLATEAPEGAYFHRARMQITVNGSEEALYRWFDRLNLPEQLRIASSIRLSPNAQDDSQIDCTATVEQWFVPLPPSA